MNNNEKFNYLITEFEQETKKRAKENLKINEPIEKLRLTESIEKLKAKGYNPYLRDYDFICFCRDMRNGKFHDNKYNNYFNVTDELIEKLEEVIDEVKHPFSVESKATKNVFSASLSYKVKDTMKEMSNKCYTHIPVYKDDKKSQLVGIFSENMLFDFISKNGYIVIEENTTFEEIQECISLNNINGKIEFVSRKLLYDDVINKFIKEYKNNNRLECIMVTHSGDKTEKVIGILTTWDIIGRN